MKNPLYKLDSLLDSIDTLSQTVEGLERLHRRFMDSQWRALKAGFIVGIVSITLAEIFGL